jgi:hypothetical protein
LVGWRPLARLDELLQLGLQFRHFTAQLLDLILMRNLGFRFRRRRVSGWAGSLRKGKRIRCDPKQDQEHTPQFWRAHVFPFIFYSENFPGELRRARYRVYRNAIYENDLQYVRTDV